MIKPLFRAYDPKNKIMYLPNFPFIGAGSGARDIAITLNGHVITPSTYGLDAMMAKEEVPELIIMQYIDVQDKNKVPICEGDVIRKDNGVWGVIVRNGPFFEVTVSEDQSSLYTAEWISDSEVIGNIHQNPELLTITLKTN